MDFVAKEEIILALGFLLSIGVGIASGTNTFTLARAGLPAKAMRVSPELSRIHRGTTTLDYL